jgi:amidohydrolase
MSLAAALCVSLCFQAPAKETASATFARWIEGERARWIEVRRDLHRHPELSGEEERTAGIVAARLRVAGLEVRTAVGGHGVVGILRGARAGQVVAYRADMDAVRSAAHDPVEFRSLEPEKRHICGHDVHTTIALALAEGLAAQRAELAGTLVFVFQPAEETATGARAMLDQHALDDPKPAAIFALHTAPFEVGEFAVAEGPMMAGRDRALVSVTGSGAVVEVARELAREVQGLSMIAPEKLFEPAPLDALVVEALVQPGQDGAWSVLTVATSASRAARGEVREMLETLVRELARPDVALALEYAARWLPGVENDPALTRTASARLRAEFGPNSVVPMTDVVLAFSEDFGHFQDLAPGVMFFLGVSSAKNHTAGMPHAPTYVADEEAIFVGARAMAAVLVNALEAR